MRIVIAYERFIQWFTMWRCPRCGEVWTQGPKVCPKCQWQRGK